MKLLTAGLMALTFSSAQLHAKPCKVYVDNPTRGSGYGWYTTKAEANALYKEAIEESGHERVSSAAEADYLYYNFASHEKEGQGIFGLPGRGIKHQLFYALYTADKTLVAKKKFFSCRVSGREADQGVECGPVTVSKHPQRGSRNLAKMLKDISCDF